MNVTLQTLAGFPDQLDAHYAMIPERFKTWTPSSWEGIPSEHLTALEQIGHIRDVELDGYQLRFRRALNEHHAFLPSLDTDALAKTYVGLDAQTVAMLRSLDESQLSRTADFEGYGPVTVRSLIHYLCSHDQQHLAGLQWIMGKLAMRNEQ